MSAEEVNDIMSSIQNLDIDHMDFQDQLLFMSAIYEFSKKYKASRD